MHPWDLRRWRWVSGRTSQLQWLCNLPRMRQGWGWLCYLLCQGSGHKQALSLAKLRKGGGLAGWAGQQWPPPPASQACPDGFIMEPLPRTRVEFIGPPVKPGPGLSDWHRPGDSVAAGDHRLALLLMGIPGERCLQLHQGILEGRLDFGIFILNLSSFKTDSMASPTQWTWVYTPGVGDVLGRLAYCSPWGRKEWDTTEWLKSKKCVEAIFRSLQMIFCKLNLDSELPICLLWYKLEQIFFLK